MAKFTNSYAIDVKQWNGDYGHKFEPVSAEELVNWDGIVARNINPYVGLSYLKENTHE